jgi:hypothetical protein
MYNQEELSDFVRYISHVHYEAKVEEMQDGHKMSILFLVSILPSLRHLETLLWR